MEPSWLAALRARANTAFNALPEPDFHYGLDIKIDHPLKLGSLAAPTPVHTEPHAAKGIVTPLAASFSQLNGQFLSLLQPTDKFAAFHAAHASNGWLIHIPANVELHEPIILAHDAAAATAVEHVVILAGENSKATILQTVSSSNGPRYASIATEAFLAAGAKLQIASLQTLPETTFAYAAQRAKLGPDSQLDWVTGDFGGSVVLADMAADLAGRGAKFRTHAALFGSDAQVFNTSLNVTHTAPDTACDLQSRGALTGKAKAIYRGLIRVPRTGARANGYQKADVLILSPDAEADPVPALEIDTNDVRCSHGTTVGRLDAEKLFYLQSRGLPLADAKQLLVRGFFSPLLGHVPEEATRTQLSCVLEGKIKAVQ